MNKALLSIILSMFLLFACKKDRQKAQLPEETQIGANTFGCLVDGEVFVPGGAQLSGGSLNCYYQLVKNGYYFVLIGKYNNSGNGGLVGLFCDSLKIENGKIYSLKVRKQQNSSAVVSKYTNEIYKKFDTKDSLTIGELWIKKFDTINQIVSGTFWFDAVTETGEIVQVREGRFDVNFTR